MKLNFQVSMSVKEDGKNKDEYRLENDLNGELTLEELVKYAKRTLIVVADKALREEQAKGFDSKPVVTVDNITGKPVADVKPFGKIEFNSRVTESDLLVPILKGLLERSKVDHGTYIESHFVFYNGILVANTVAELEEFTKNSQFKNGDVIRFVNLMPYAGKLERLGVTGGANGRQQARRVLSTSKKKREQGIKVRVPNGAYQLTLRATQRISKRNASIKFAWINGASLNLAGVRTTTKDGKKLRTTFHPKSGRKGSYVYPSIVVRIGEVGLV